MERTTELRGQLAAASLEYVKNYDTEGLFEHLLNHTLPLFEASRDALKIGLVEEMKRPTEGPLFAYFKRNMAANQKYYEEAGIPLQGWTEYPAYVLFRVFFPLMGLVLLGEEWSDHMGTNKDDLQKSVTRWIVDDYCRHINELAPHTME
jgi:hypothetical protein